MTQDKTNKVSNVPPLRFPEFTGEWDKKRLQEECNFFSGGTPSSSNKEYYEGDIPFIRSGEIDAQYTELFLTQKGYNSSSAKMVDIGDILLALYGATSGEIAISKMHGAINQAILCIRSPYNNVFVKSVWEKHVQHILQTYLQGGQGNLSADIVKKLSFYFPSIREQNKISKLIASIDQRISTQIRVIEDLQTLKKAISTKVFTEIKGCNSEKLGSLCSITTGKLDANAMTEEGQYMFFTCSRENYKTDTFAYEGEALLIAGNGEIGSVKYYDGKFNAYQRTYVLQNFSENIKYLQYYIEHHLPKRVLKEKNVGAMPYIVLSTLADMPILLPSENKQNNIVKALQVIENKIYTEYSVLDQYKQQKQYLLQKMFI